MTLPFKSEFRNRGQIKNWPKFAKKVRSKGCRLLCRLDKFSNPILVTGCQRSGTTLLSRIVTLSEGMTNYWTGGDDELDAALILSGNVPHEPNGRYCFQTTYLNECVNEYFNRSKEYKLIWVLRNPFSVVYSMVYNWKRFALNELFKACGENQLKEKHKKKYFGILRTSKLKRACHSYNGKVSQVFEIKKKLGDDTVLIIDYDILVKRKNRILPQIYSFIGLKYKDEYAEKVHSISIDKYKSFSNRKRQIVKEICMPVYEHASNIASVIE